VSPGGHRGNCKKLMSPVLEEEVGKVRIGEASFERRMRGSMSSDRGELKRNRNIRPRSRTKSSTRMERAKVESGRGRARRMERRLSRHFLLITAMSILAGETE